MLKRNDSLPSNLMERKESALRTGSVKVPVNVCPYLILWKASINS